VGSHDASTQVKIGVIAAVWGHLVTGSALYAGMIGGACSFVTAKRSGDLDYCASPTERPSHLSIDASTR
jgi:hypothetical protein